MNGYPGRERTPSLETDRHPSTRAVGACPKGWDWFVRCRKRRSVGPQPLGAQALPYPNPIPTVLPSFAAAPALGVGKDLPDPAPLGLCGFELSLDTASLDVLDAVARSLDGPRIKDWFDSSSGAEEVALLATCNRVELVLAFRSPTEGDQWLRRLPGDAGSWRPRTGRELVQHIFEVAAGQKSLALGEREVRLQVRAAAHSTLSRHPRPVIRELMESAAAAADEIAPSVPPARSIAALAASKLLEQVAFPFPRVIVIGAGSVGRQLTELLAGSARVTLVYRSRPPDERFLRTTGARAVPFTRLAEELGVADAVITAAKSGNRCLGPADLPALRRLVMIDLGVPRNIDPAVRGVPNVELFDLEGLRSLRTPSSRDDAADAALSGLADRFWARFELLALEAWVDALRRSIEELRRSELEVARPFLGALTVEQEVAVERLTQRLVAQILLAPTERLRSLPTGPDGEQLRRFALALLAPATTRP